MKKLLIFLVVFLLLLGLGGAGALWYISPGQNLDMAYQKVPLVDRAVDMAKRMSTELILTEGDINNIAKQALSETPGYSGGIVVTGAKFQLAGERLIADLNIRYRDRIPAALKLSYRLEWRSPDLVAVIEEAKLRDIPLSTGYFGNVAIPISRQLPGILTIRSVRIQNESLIVEFQKPTLEDLNGLLH
ncbi:hypothetical protein [Paenibacillus nasutitermitis]|uniref:Uncharacterized protein n=1 Tax=Paenibacillus nasutitermitis TaxID=1652958 RepID=A0A916YYM2_9BACL|nr:hypothetical protein [Paenibacillus nasutitermitis]GGD66834.1 hypothetical protein GCM10010911_25730 [Paenibacillus nasutitermitis]